jgi:hypothetical protein
MQPESQPLSWLPPEGLRNVNAAMVIAVLWMVAATVLSLFPVGSTPGFCAAVCIVLLIAAFAGYGSPGIRGRVKLTRPTVLTAPARPVARSWGPPTTANPA